MAPSSVITVSYQRLAEFDGRDLDLVEQIGKAFGSHPEALGILSVTDVPDWDRYRQKLLPLAQKIAQLKDTTPVELPHAKYSTGWSHGRETLNQHPDFAKGSFYANPQTNDLIHELSLQNPNKDWKSEAQSYPEFYADNVWPKDLPEIEPAFMEMGQKIRQVGLELARVCDVYCKQHGVEARMEQALKASWNTKGRLLHYFDVSSSDDKKDEDEKLWCGWHNDHGSLTGLVPGMFLNTKGEQVASPDPSAGLYIQTRNGKIVQVRLPPTVCAFQIGETSQIQSGGLLQATPHAVRCGNTHGVTRESFAVFLEPNFDEPLKVPSEQNLAAEAVLPKAVVPLSRRWKPGQTFGDFHVATINAFLAE